MIERRSVASYYRPGNYKAPKIPYPALCQTDHIICIAIAASTIPPSGVHSVACELCLAACGGTGRQCGCAAPAAAAALLLLSLLFLLPMLGVLQADPTLAA